MAATYGADTYGTGTYGESAFNPGDEDPTPKQIIVLELAAITTREPETAFTLREAS